MTTTFGAGQSPVDIVRAEVERRRDLSPLTIHYPDEPVVVDVGLAVVDGDSTPDGLIVVPQVVAAVGHSNAYVTVGTERFDLQSFHWHSPSEHLVDGKAFPLEVHLVHSDTTGRLLVVGVFFEVGAEDHVSGPIFEQAASLDQQAFARGVREVLPVSVRIADLVPARPETFRYSGSLTTAPFTGGVSWFVCQSIRSASADQIATHMDLVSDFPGYQGRPQRRGNARAPQDLGDRVITTDG